MNILGNIVLLTGGSAGIGRATAEYLMRQGYTVYAASRRGSENIEDPFSGGRIPPREDRRGNMPREWNCPW